MIKNITLWVEYLGNDNYENVISALKEINNILNKYNINVTNFGFNLREPFSTKEETP